MALILQVALSSLLLLLAVVVSSQQQQKLYAGHHAFISVQPGGESAFAWGEGAALGRADSQPAMVSNAQSSVSRIKSACLSVDYSCYLREDGTIACMGESTSGQKGIARSTAAAVRAEEIFCGYYHSCVLDANGGLQCAGSNFRKNLGQKTGETYYDPVPFATFGASGVLHAATGDYFTCIITSHNNAVSCVGKNNFGQYGDGTVFDLEYASTPVPSLVTQGALRLAAGDHHVCVLTTTGAVKCWGSNVYGQVGKGEASNEVSTPYEVWGDYSVVKVACGRYATCTLMNNVEQSVLCFGSNGHGQFGLSEPSLFVNPLYLELQGAPMVNVSDLAISESAVCVTRGNEPGVFCAGSNERGELGRFVSGSASQVFDRVAFSPLTPAPTTRPAMPWTPPGSNGNGIAPLTTDPSVVAATIAGVLGFASMLALTALRMEQGKLDKLVQEHRNSNQSI